VKAKDGVIGICRAGLETLRALQTESLLAAGQRDVAEHILMRGSKAHEVCRDHTLRRY